MNAVSYYLAAFKIGLLLVVLLVVLVNLLTPYKPSGSCRWTTLPPPPPRRKEPTDMGAKAPCFPPPGSQPPSCPPPPPPYRQSAPDAIGITDPENAVLGHLDEAWNTFVCLGDSRPDDAQEFRAAIHAAQNIIASRVARRVDPGQWWQNKKGY